MHYYTQCHQLKIVLIRRIAGFVQEDSTKKLFGSERHEAMLISFVNAILELKRSDLIQKVQLLPKDQAPLIKGDKSMISH